MGISKFDLRRTTEETVPLLDAEVALKTHRQDKFLTPSGVAAILKAADILSFPEDLAHTDIRRASYLTTMFMVVPIEEHETQGQSIERVKTTVSSVILSLNEICMGNELSEKDHLFAEYFVNRAQELCGHGHSFGKYSDKGSS